MASRRGLTIGAVALLVAAAAAAVILLNLTLLGYAQPRNDPVGKLSPRAALTPGVTTTTSVSAPPLPPVTTTKHRGEQQDD